MSRLVEPVELIEGGASRRLEAGDFPLLIGGVDADVAIPGVGPQPVAYLALDDGELFVQPGESQNGAVRCNGAPLSSSQWLRGGDVVTVGASRIRIETSELGLRLRVEHPAPDNDTEPPLATAARRQPVGGSDAAIAPVRFEPREVARRSGRGARRRWPTVLFWGAGLLLAGVAWLLFTSRAVELDIDPQPERLRIEGGLPALRIAERHLLRPGRYTVIAERQGYRQLRVPIEVTGDSNQSFRFALSPLTGRLEIETMPGVSVSVDDEPQGVTPLAPLELEAGVYELRLEADRHLPYVASVSIEGGGATERLVAELTPAWAEVSVSTLPSGALVEVDGEGRGRTPLVAELLAGSRVMVLRLPGHKPRRLTVEVTAGQPLSVGPVRLGLDDGRLELVSEPAGAAVTVDGFYQGETPLELALAAGTSHLLYLSKQGYESLTREVEIGSGDREALRLELVARAGEIEVLVSPPDAEVLVDGELLGQGSQTLHLAAVTHELEVRKPGYAPFRTTVTPRPGFQQEVRAELTTVAEAREASIARVLTTPAGHELRLIEVGRRFEMGASRREPGRRANESLRQVVLTRRFYISTHEVSNRQFRRFDRDHQSGLAGLLSLEGDDLPAVRVTWEEAAAYCNWLSEQEGLPPVYAAVDGSLAAVEPLATGYRLPTEAEWAWVARYPDGERRKYPWGDSLPVAAGSGNYADRAARDLVAGALPSYDDGFAATAPVTSFDPNPLGLHNLGGNVAEWVHDRYTIYTAAQTAELARDPLGPEAGEHHVIRGSSFLSASVTELRLSYRDYGAEGRPDVGFRIARYLE